MIPELGHFALIIGLCIAFVQALVPLAGTAMGVQRWIAMAVPAALAQLLFIGISYACLTWAFLVHDFSVLYAAQNSNTELPLIYRISGVWGAHEGSLLLWALVLSLWTGAVALFTPNVPRAMRARVLAVLGLVSCGFLLFIVVTSNPFERLLPAATEGRDLNPLLQDIGLAIHPPMLYIGYVGFAVAFAFSIAALISGQVDSAWARWSRPWTNVAWLFLTLGIALGSWWAYYELGWGGWWFWDPVENASFMPWLVGTALMHSLAITEKRGTFKAWTALLAIFAFALSLLGTFLVRSGVLTCLRQRSRARRVYSRFPGAGGRWIADAVRLAGAAAEERRTDQFTVARRRPAAEQHFSRRGDRGDSAGYPVPDSDRRPGRQDFGRAALLQPDVYPDYRAARRIDGCGHAHPLEER
jgi:cytochrome c-type biogenesis protein CcmF